VVPFQAGGPIDAIGRIVAQQLSEHWGQSFFVENRTGGGGNIGMELVAKAPADGYTLALPPAEHMVRTQRSMARNCRSILSKILRQSRCSRR